MTESDAEWAHPLTSLFENLLRGRFPPFDGLLDVVAPVSPHPVALFVFSGHHVLAADVSLDWVLRYCPPGDLSAPVYPSFVLALERTFECSAGPLDLVLCARHLPPRECESLVEVEPDSNHPRMGRSLRRRTEVRAYRTQGSEGVLTIARGVAGRLEASFEVDAAHRNRGIGRRLARASRSLINENDGIFMQVAAGNVASLRAVQAAGFVPVGAEILFLPVSVPA